MPFEPEFMRKLGAFRAERDSVRNLEQWQALSDKWLDTTGWPTKGPEQTARESAGKLGPVRLGGRLWSHTSLAYDISPEARYELIYTLKAVGDPIRFPLE